jgi:ribosome biogenesis protein ERB1
VDKNQKKAYKQTKSKRENKSINDKSSSETNLGISNSYLNNYGSDSSDEEDIRNTVGNIPMKWYDNSKHLGYDWDGKQILKPEQGNQLENFLKRMEDPDFWRTIKDYQTGQDVVLSDADIELITRIQKQRIPDAQFNEYAVSKYLILLLNIFKINYLLFK